MLVSTITLQSFPTLKTQEEGKISYKKYKETIFSLHILEVLCVSIRNSVPCNGILQWQQLMWVGVYFSHITSSQTCTSWSQNGCPSSRQYICIQAKMKGQKAQKFLYAFIRSTKTFPGSCLLLSLPTSFLPPRGLLLFKSYGSELGCLTTFSYKGHWKNILIGLHQSGSTA